jgi:phage terminase small subunit
MTRAAIPPAPSDLSTRGKRLWRDVHRDWVLDASADQLLLIALRAFDRADAARALLRRDGLMVAGTRGPRPHPAVSIERSATETALKAWRALGFDTIAAGPMGRPPGRGPA